MHPQPPSARGDTGFRRSPSDKGPPLIASAPPISLSSEHETNLPLKGKEDIVIPVSIVVFGKCFNFNNFMQVFISECAAASVQPVTLFCWKAVFRSFHFMLIFLLLHVFFTCRNIFIVICTFLKNTTKNNRTMLKYHLVSLLCIALLLSESGNEFFCIFMTIMLLVIMLLCFLNLFK